MPTSRIGRSFLGTALIISGILGFLPVLGFWMIPLGIIVLSIDIAIIRRHRRKIIVWWLRRKKPRRAKRAIPLLEEKQM
jgi:hypothetical protein